MKRYASAALIGVSQSILRTFTPKGSHVQIFFKLATQKSNDILLPRRQKKLRVRRLRVGENMPREIP